MIRFSLFFLFLHFYLFSISQEKVVHVKHANGTAQVVYYYETIFFKKVLVKQEIFFENGKLEYSGEWKHGKEHGKWNYYYDNGQLKAEEFWTYGKETGTWKEYNKKGQLVKTIQYQSGKVIETKTY